MTTRWDLDCSAHPAALASAVLHRPDAHPFWSYYQISAIHLRPIEGMAPARKHNPASTHELQVLALKSHEGFDPSQPSTFKALLPPNLIIQIESTDELAIELWSQLVRAIDDRELNPDTDHRSAQLAWLRRLTVERPRVSDLVAYGSRCAWWDDKQRVGSRRVGAHALPCCPHCSGVLLETTWESWTKGVEEHAEQSGDGAYPAFIEWLRGKCFPSLRAARAAYDASKPN